MSYEVILADDQAVFRTGVARMLAVESDFRLLTQCSSTDSLLNAVQESRGALVMFSITLQVDLAALMERADQTGGWLVAVLENGQSVSGALRESVHGIVFRDVNQTELLRCLRCVARGSRYMQASAASDRHVNSEAERVRERLTPKEMRIVSLIARGYKNKDIAIELHNTEQVIKNYLRSIFDKTGVADRLELALFAIQHRVLPEADEEPQSGALREFLHA